MPILYTHELLASHLRKAYGAYVFEQRTEEWSIKDQDEGENCTSFTTCILRHLLSRHYH
jgi:hypothetical protein